MTKHASPSSFFTGQPEVVSSPASFGLNEFELSNWAEQSTIAGVRTSRAGRIGLAAFWIVIAGLLLARFTLIDQSMLRPAAPSVQQASPISQR